MTQDTNNPTDADALIKTLIEAAKWSGWQEDQGSDTNVICAARETMAAAAEALRARVAELETAWAPDYPQRLGQYRQRAHAAERELAACKAVITEYRESGAAFNKEKTALKWAASGSVRSPMTPHTSVTIWPKRHSPRALNDDAPPLDATR